MLKDHWRAIVVIVIVCAIGGTLGALFWNRTDPDTPFGEIQKARRAQEFFHAQTRVPMDDLSAVVDSLSKSTPIPGQPDGVDIPSDLQAQLWAFLAEWLNVRRSGDPAEFAAWTQRRGYSLTSERSDAERYPAGMSSELENMWRHYTGNRRDPLPATMKGREAFDLFYTASMKEAGGIMRPVAVAGDSRVIFKLIDASDENSSPLPLQDWEGEDHWMNYSTVGNFVHWMSAQTYGDVLRRDGSMMTAVVLLGVQGASGDWLPLMFTCYYDPDAGLWKIQQVAYSNAVRKAIEIER